MTFTTLTFVLFLIVVFAGYWSLREVQHQNAWLVLASYVFYGWWDWRFCGLMFASSLLDYVIGIMLASTDRERRRKLLLAVSVLVQLGLLGFFKYYNFFSESAADLLRLLGFHASPTTLQIVLPVGISFYTFQTLSYTIDVYRRQLPATRDAAAFFAYVSFFPQLVAGPIERATNLLPQIENPRRFDYQDAVEGCRLALWGFFKKLAVADNLAVVVDQHYSRISDSSGPALAFATLCFSFQIYCDFSAYSDIAAGCARLFGIKLMRNFALPYFSQDVSEFWRRWHISLSTWFRDYLYVPLGGSRVGRLARARNVLLTFTVSGLWHGASWNFVLWGAINGLAVLPSALSPGAVKRRREDVPGGEGLLPSPWRALSIAATFLFTCFCWVLFRSPTLGDALLVFRRIATGPWDPLTISAATSEKAYLLLLVAFLVGIEWATRRSWHPLQVHAWPRPLRWAAYMTLGWATVLLTRPNPSSFIYFQF